MSFDELKDFFISIHAPTRGATNIIFIGGIKSIFQSTLPREERRKFSTSFCKILHFNPRSHERSDAEKPLKAEISQQFQSTLPREERRKNEILRTAEKRFQSTLPREERLNHQVIFHSSTISIHAPTRGATNVGEKI